MSSETSNNRSATPSRRRSPARESGSDEAGAMPRSLVHRCFAVGYGLMILLFAACSLVLIGLAAIELWHAVAPSADVALRQRFNGVLESIGLLTIAVVALELAQTVYEEEVERDVKVSGPTRVRRFLSRFLVVIIVALAIETLVSVFELAHDNPAQLPYAASIGATAALLLVAWGVFVRLNRSAEELEPEAMAETKREDRKVQR